MTPGLPVALPISVLRPAAVGDDEPEHHERPEGEHEGESLLDGMQGAHVKGDHVTHSTTK